MSILLVGLPAFSARGGFSSFASLEKPVSIQLAGDKFIASAGSPARLFTISLDGSTVMPFAQHFLGLPENESYIAVSPGLAGFSSGDIFVTAGPAIWKISPDGISATVFVTLPGVSQGLTFDQLGTFGGKLITTTLDGKVFVIDKNGVATLLVDLDPGDADVSHVESVTVAPIDFGSVGGQLIVTKERSGEVVAINNNGTVTLIASGIPFPENADFVPPSIDAEDAFFVASRLAGMILKAPATDFQGLEGALLVTSEFFPGFFVITPQASGIFRIIARDLFGPLNGAEDSIFVNLRTRVPCFHCH